METDRLGLTDKQLKAKDRALQKNYGITVHEFASILASQGWRCPICRAEYEKGKLWAVDHEHREGNEGPVRGILCYRCNRYKVGKLSIQDTARIYDYLIDPPAYYILGGERVAKGIPRRRRRSKRSNASSPGGVRRTRKPE